MIFPRKNTRKILLGSTEVGGDAPISVQSMTNTDTSDAESTIRQIEELSSAGCEIVRVAVKDRECVKELRKIVSSSPIPVVADVHFDYRLAVAAVQSGVQGLRINPGNIGSKRKIEEVVRCARDHGVPIRIGVNAGSLEKDLEAKYGPTVKALVGSALRHVSLLESLGFYQIKVSLKSSDVVTVVQGYTELSERVDYPLHLGVTEAGTVLSGSTKSAVALGILLSRGIGDTIRISLTGPPVQEVKVAYWILQSLGLKKRCGVEIVSCPTCGRCRWDLLQIAEEIEKRVSHVDKHLKVAVMGCSVNGPGEARHADIGISGGEKEFLLFKKGHVVNRLPREEIVEALIREIDDY